MSTPLVIGGYVVLVVLAVGWVAWAAGGDTPHDPIDDEWRRLCEEEEVS